MKRRNKTAQEREAIAAEYLLGEESFRSLGRKYGVNFRHIHLWVQKLQGIEVRKTNPKLSQKPTLAEPLPTDVGHLQEELRKAKLHAELLSTMIDIAEKELGVNIRKKSGAKQ